MRAGIIGFFDIGASYGLADDVFPATERTPDPDIGLVGIEFPLGQGLLLDVSEYAPSIADAGEQPFRVHGRPGGGALLDWWRDQAKTQVRRAEMETGWSPTLGMPKHQFLATLEQVIEAARIRRCEMRIHAVGVVLTELQFENDIPLPFVQGVLNCFEFAAYRPWIALPLHRAARWRVTEALGRSRSGLVELSARNLPMVKSDSHGYEELMLFAGGFTDVIVCTDPDDDRALAELTTRRARHARLNPLSRRRRAMQRHPLTPLTFEYHGTLHYSWELCVLEAKHRRNWREEPPDQQIMRMESCVRVAHVFHGACDAFIRLFDSELHLQVGGYVRREVAGRKPEELNRLRTLALALVNLTEFSKVTPTAEDQIYFREYEQSAHLASKQRAIQEATEVLYNIQVAESQLKTARRQWVLSLVVGLLTSLTLISVTTDGYDFVREDEALMDQPYRLALLGLELFLIITILLALSVLAARSRHRRPVSPP